jgi:hypothetical protein
MVTAGFLQADESIGCKELKRLEERKEKVKDSQKEVKERSQS